MVFNRLEQRLITWVASSKGVELDVPFAQVDLRTNQSVRPRLADLERPSEQGNASTVRCSSDEDDHAIWILVVGLPTIRDFPSSRRAFDPRRGPLSHGANVFVRLRSQVLPRAEMEPVPYLALPSSVVTFDRRLKARFARRCEHRDHAQRKGHSGNPAQDVHLAWSLENGVVVKLNMSGKPNSRQWPRIPFTVIFAVIRDLGNEQTNPP